MKYVLDTNIFNRVLDGKFELSAVVDAEQFVVTNVQRSELEATRNKDRRESLMRKFTETAADSVATESFCFDVKGSGLDESKWPDDETRLDSLKSSLDSIKPKPNNIQDALIAEVALVNHYGLVTADRNLAEVAKKHMIVVHLELIRK